MDKSVIISYQFYMNLFINDIIINFNETKRKEEEKIKKKKKGKEKTRILVINIPRSVSPHTRCFHELHSAALLYVNRKIHNILGATCKWFHSTSQPSMLPTVKVHGAISFDTIQDYQVTET